MTIASTSSTPRTTAWWRLIRFVAREDGQTYFGQPVNDSLDVGLAYAEQSGPIEADVLDTHPLCGDGALSGVIRTVAALLPPLLPSEVTTIRALGGNFVPAGQTAVEALQKRTPIPILFYKPPSALSGPSRDIVIPPCVAEETDYEVELVVVLGRSIKNASAAEATASILGYTLGNDLTARIRQNLVAENALGKSFDGWFPIGPTLVSATHPRGITNPDNVRLTTTLNTTRMQDGTTADMIWKIAETLVELSRGTTLLAGSLVSMGTPAGTLFPQGWLKHGDMLHMWGSDGLGSLINRVRAETKADDLPAMFKATL